VALAESSSLLWRVKGNIDKIATASEITKMDDTATNASSL